MLLLPKTLTKRWWRQTWSKELNEVEGKWNANVANSTGTNDRLPRKNSPLTARCARGTSAPAPCLQIGIPSNLSLIVDGRPPSRSSHPRVTHCRTQEISGRHGDGKTDYSCSQSSVHNKSDLPWRQECMELGSLPSLARYSHLQKKQRTIV